VQTAGTEYGALYDSASMAPLVNNEAMHASLTTLAALWHLSDPLAVTSCGAAAARFAAGKCAITLGTHQMLQVCYAAYAGVAGRGGAKQLGQLLMKVAPLRCLPGGLLPVPQ
jgi:hypothetical protein